MSVFQPPAAGLTAKKDLWRPHVPLSRVAFTDRPTVFIEPDGSLALLTDKTDIVGVTFGLWVAYPCQSRIADGHRCQFFMVRTSRVVELEDSRLLFKAPGPVEKIKTSKRPHDSRQRLAL
jgi:hypothetical protein